MDQSCGLWAGEGEGRVQDTCVDGCALYNLERISVIVQRESALHKEAQSVPVLQKIIELLSGTP